MNSTSGRRSVLSKFVRDDEAVEPEELGAAAWSGDHAVMTGSCSWTDRTLVEEADWYPQRTMSAEDRLRYYAAQFPLTEIDSTYYAPPAEREVALWAARTPDGFRFDVKAYSLLTGHPTRPRSLWRDLRDDLPPDVAEKRNIYAKHLGADAMDEAWRRFESALRPFYEAEKLGAVLFQYPPWFGPRKDNRAEIEALRERLPRLPDQRRVPFAAMAGRGARPRADAEDARGARPDLRVRRCAAGLGVAARDGGDESRTVSGPLPRALG